MAKLAFAQRFYDAWFRRVHGHRLIYNTCWEDPRLDRELLQLDRASRVAMITSAGCNALDYLLDDPAAIHCIDVNARQNALLELKIAALRVLDHDEFFKLFGEGRHPAFDRLYDKHLKPQLSASAQQFWSRNGHYFAGRGLRRSFYFYGAAGDVAWIVGSVTRLARPKLRKSLLDLIEAETLEEQRALYARIEPELWGPLSRWFVRQPMTLSLLGVPRAQRDLIEQQYPGGVAAYVQDKIRYLFTELPVKDNYFWRVYLTGEYTRSCCPNYLRAENMPLLRARIDRVHLHTTTFARFLQSHQGELSHFVLLDHQDWLAWHDPHALEEEWRLILERSAPGARVLLRSAALNVDFFPGFVRERLEEYRDVATRTHARDRVGTYGCTVLAGVRS